MQPTNPTGRPTSDPTRQPTGQPSSEPTAQPTGQPSGRPTRAPFTSTPTGVPSTKPTQKPVTPRPTTPGGSQYPTGQPTSAPSWALNNYDESKLYPRYVKQDAHNKGNFTKVSTFERFSYKGTAVIGSCEAWNYHTKSLLLPFDDLYFSSLTFGYGFIDYDRGAAVREIKHNCAQRADVASLINAMYNKKSVSTYCGTKHLWRVFSCQGEVTLCVNCDEICKAATETKPAQRLCPAQQPMFRDKSIWPLVLNPCATNCPRHVDSYATIGWDIGVDILYPEISGGGAHVNVTTAKRSITANIQVNREGTVSCGAFAKDSVLTSTLPIKNQGFNSLASRPTATLSAAPIVISIVIDNLVPDSAYDVYCYTEDFNAHYMPLEVALKSKTRVSTECCKTIAFSTFVPAVSNSSLIAAQPYKFYLDALPTSPTRVQVVLTANVTCAEPLEAGVRQLAAAYPSTFDFSQSSSSTEGTFIVKGAPGCYDIVVEVDSTRRRLTGDFFSPTKKSMVIRSSKRNPDAPKLVKAYFGDNPVKLYFDFDSDTDRGATMIVPTTRYPGGHTGAFNCSVILNHFPGLMASQSCAWENAKRMVLTLGRGNPVTGENAEIGDKISFKPGVLKPKTCPLVKDCFSNAGAVVTLQKPNTPLKPVISLSTPGESPECSDISIDSSNTKGDGGREWKLLRWTVTIVSGALESSGDWINKVNPEKLAELNVILNRDFGSTKRPAIAPSSHLVSPAVYKIELHLTNFLQESSLKSITVTKTAKKKQPIVSIPGPQTVRKLRANPVSLFAFGYIPKCPGVILNASVPLDRLVYEWKVFQGTQYMNPATHPALISKSKDPRYFKLNPFVLSASTVYTVEVTTKTDEPDGARATYKVDIEVGSAGVVASILGGSSRSGSTKANVFFESGSYDLDYPTDTNALAYLWECVERFPNFGDACPSDLSGATTLRSEIPKGAFIRGDGVDASYDITLYVRNSKGLSSSASTTITMVFDEIPEIAFQIVPAKFNPNEKVILSSTVSAVKDAWVIWSSDDFADADFRQRNLTAALSRVPSGNSVKELAIAPNTFAAGGRYTIVLSSTYSSSPDIIQKFEKITILMNSPPTVGNLFVDPRNGTAMVTIFNMQASDFSDDVDDYPIYYVMLIYSDPTKKSVVKTSGEVTYANVKLGQGIEELDFAVQCEAQARDIYGAASSAFNNTVVLAPQEAALESAATAQVEEALTNSDPAAVANVANAVASSLNVKNCTVPLPCDNIGRLSCASGSTPKTCGKCLPGLIGVDGDANTECQAPNLIKRVGETCVINKDCASGLCKNAKCDERDKICNNDCSGHGACKFYTTAGLAVGKCAASDGNCYSQCNCSGSYSGSDCSLTPDKFAVARRMRESLCIGIYKTVAIQDITADVVSSRCQTLSALLSDPTQLTIGGITNCTMALVLSIEQAPAFVGIEGVSDLAANTLSDVLASNLPADLAQRVLDATTLLTTAVQNNMAVGEEQKDFTTDNARIGASVNDPNALESSSFSSSQTDAEKFQGTPATETRIGNGNSGKRRRLFDASVSAVGVTVVQVKNKQSDTAVAAARRLAGDDASATDSTPTGIQVTEYGTETRRRRMTAYDDGWTHFDQMEGVIASRRTRRMQSSASEISVIITLQNTAPAEYFNLPATTANVTCMPSEAAYNISVTCKVLDAITALPVSQAFSLGCPISKAGRNYTYTCPQLLKAPACKTWDGSAFAINPECELVSFTDTATTCSCPVGTSRRRLGLVSGAQSELKQFSSSARIIAGGFMKTMSVFDDINAGGGSGWEKFSRLVSGNTVIFSTMTSILVLTIFGLALTAWKDKTQVAKWHEKQMATLDIRKKKATLRNISTFLNDCLPIEFSGKAWYKRWWQRLSEEHDWIVMLLPYHPSRDFAWVKYTIGMGKIINFMFIDTILVGLFFNDDGTCGSFTSETSCHELRSLDQIDTLCHWNFDKTGYEAAVLENGGVLADANGVPLLEFFQTCKFNQLSTEFLPNLVLVMVLTTFCVPLDKFVTYLVYNVAALFSTPTVEEGPNVNVKTPTIVNNPNVGGNHRADDAAYNPETDYLLDDHQVYDKEIRSCLDMKGLILRAARLKRMQSLMENVSANQEADLLVKSATADTAKAARSRLSLTTEILVKNIEAQKVTRSTLGSMAAVYSVSTLKSEEFYDADAGRQLLKHETLGDSQGLVHKAIARARDECDVMCAEMHEIAANAEKDAFLLQRFITDSLRGIERTLAFRFFFPEEGGGVHYQLKSYCCLLLLLAYATFCCMYVFLFGVVLGPDTVTMWLQGVVIAFLQMVFVLDPFKCFVMFVMLSHVPSQRIRFIHAVLRDRAKAIISRNVGVVRDANAIVQHLSPACRTARQFPHLSMSRLLMSLNDHDIPINFLLNESENTSWGAFLLKAVVGVMLFTCLILILLLPEIVGDSVMEVLSNLLVNVTIGVGYYLTNVGGTVALPIGIFVGIIVLFMLYEHAMEKRRESRNHTWHLRALNTIAKNSNDDVDEHHDNELDRSIDVVLKEKHASHQGWRARLSMTKKARMAMIMVAPGSPEAMRQKKLRLGLKIKNVPSVSTLVEQGIIPDIFSAAPAKKDLDETVKESIVSKYAKKYRASPIADDTSDSRFPAVGEVLGFSRRPSSKALQRADSRGSAKAKNPLEMHMSDTSGDDAPMPLRVKAVAALKDTTQKEKDTGTGDLFSLHTEGDSDDTSASRKGLSSRSSRRAKRQKTRSHLLLSGGDPNNEGGGVAVAREAQVEENKTELAQSPIDDLFALDGAAYESEYTGALSPVQIAERAKRRAKRKQLKASSLSPTPVSASGGNPSFQPIQSIPALNLAKHLVTPAHIVQDDHFDNETVASSVVTVRTVPRERRKLGRRSSGRFDRLSDDSGIRVESDDKMEKTDTDTDFLFSDLGEGSPERDVIPVPTLGINRFMSAARAAPVEVGVTSTSNIGFGFGSMLDDDDDDTDSVESRSVSRHRRGMRSSAVARNKNSDEKV